MRKRKSVIPPRKYQYERRCSGTVFFFSGAINSSHPKRRSSQSRTLPQTLISSFSSSSYKNLVPASLNVKLLQRPRRRPGNIASIYVIGPVVTGAPNLVEIIAVLHCARQVRTGGRDRVVFSRCRSDQQSRPAAKTKYFSTIGFQLA